MWWTLAVAMAAPLDIASAELPNGLRVAVVENRRTDVVALHLRYGVGARDELPGEKGVAHLFEHLMFESSLNVPTGAFDRWLSEAGGQNNAWTSEDETAYHLQVPAGGLERALFLESDRMGWLGAALTQENLDNQQSVVLQERAEAFEAPRGREDDALFRLIYPPGHPYRVGAIGTVVDVQQCTLERAADFHARWYRPDNAVLVLVGNVDAQQALERVKHWFSDVPDVEGPVSVRPDLERGSPARGYVVDDVQEHTLIMSWPTVAIDHDDAPALELLAWVLSSGPGTRLDEPLYYRRGVATETDAAQWGSEWGGLFRITTSSFLRRPEALERAVLAILRDLEQGVRDSELARARAILEDSWLAQRQDPASLANLIADCWAQDGAPDCLDARWQRYAEVTPADLERVARVYLATETMSTLTIVPRDAEPPARATAVVLP